MTVEKKETYVKIKGKDTEEIYALPSGEILKKHGITVKQIDKDVYEFEVSKPVHVQLTANIRDVLLANDILISSRGFVSEGLAKIMKCEITSPYTIACEAVIDGAKGFVDRNEPVLVIGKKKEGDLFWIKPSITKEEYGKLSRDIQKFVKKTGYMR